jgi:hypothetical protein
MTNYSGDIKMQSSLHLEKMSIEDKIKIMETLWDDLCKKADSLSSPSWHNDILREREKMIKNGDDDFVEWAKAQKDIRKTVL